LWALAQPIRDSVVLHEGSRIGAGAVVVKDDVAENVLVVGVPARPAAAG
jgi:acetyltransferase-like isoleucine patch superfamily enzyme